MHTYTYTGLTNLSTVSQPLWLQRSPSKSEVHIKQLRNCPVEAAGVEAFDTNQNPKPKTN